MSESSDAKKPTGFLDQLIPKGGRAEIVGAVMMVAIVIGMILPIPVWILDMLIALNISTSCLLIVLVMQIKEPVHLSSFPSILLITTLFRVSINVASTRLILLEGNAGHIIEAFGEVVVGGNIIVGLVVFIILTLIQFLVITKGSERVAEVGARFTLDAMPGKQLAIDVELKAGAISSEEAGRKRSKLGQESQFFGAMDGALKFVKGDAIAGIAITLTNLIGGIAIGMTQKGLTGAEAVRIYSVLSIGDALVAQIPALLLSLTAGLLITRVANNGESGPRDVGKEITSQIMAYPKAWITSSMAMSVFGLLPGMPTHVFMALSAVAAFIGIRTLRKTFNPDKPDKDSDDEITDISTFEVIQPLLLRLGPQVKDEALIKRAHDLARVIRNRLVLEYGLVTHPIMLETKADKMPDGVDLEFCHFEVREFSCEMPGPFCVLECTEKQLQDLDLKASKTQPHHSLPCLIAWFPKDQMERLQKQGLAAITDWAHLANQYERVLKRRGPSYYNIDSANKIYKWIASTSPELGKELERCVPPSRFADVMQRLLSEQVSIRNMLKVAEVLVEWGQRERDPAILCECLRTSLGREICNRHAKNFELQALMFSQEIEDLIRSSIRQNTFGDYLALEPQDIEALNEQLAAKLMDVHLLKPVLLSSQDIRAQLRKLFQDRFMDLPVIGMNEVPSDFRVKVLNVIGGSQNAPNPWG